jgi:preprotein translocase subunit SecD
MVISPIAKRAPAEMNGSVAKTATAVFDQQVGSLEVNITFTSAGSAKFNRYAAQHYACYEKDPTNPPYCALQALEISGVVETAPAIEARSFPGGATIAGSSSNPFTKAQAGSVASSVRTASKLASRPA